MSITLDEIGRVKSPYQDPTDLRQHHLFEHGEGLATVVLRDNYTDGLTGLLENYSHVLVVYHYHKVNPEEASLLWRPLDDETWRIVGVFAYNTPRRPNRLGVTPCRIVSVRGNEIDLMGLDALDGSPVLDIKPYRPQCYVVRNPRVAPWTGIHHLTEYKDDHREA